MDQATAEALLATSQQSLPPIVPMIVAVVLAYILIR